ncbi:hypothetical protein ABZW32_36435 [Streptomyces sp. NPDC004667]|uniref:hypothetical protein n=1 Tax=Streptomyces sp. NPDC004667 TaxID=3154285 RepID=UPI00339EDA99
MVMVSVFGTMAADVAHVALGVPYAVSASPFAVAWAGAERGGLGLGTGPVSLVLGVIIVAVVLWLSAADRRTPRSPYCPHPHPHPLSPYSTAFTIKYGERGIAAVRSSDVVRKRSGSRWHSRAA